LGERYGREGAAHEEAVIRRVVFRAKAGDEQAIRFLYSRYAPAVHRFVSGLLGDRDTAQDVTQNTFLKLLTRLDRYVPGDAPFEAWLFRVARNAAHDELRRRRTTVVAELCEHDAAVHEDGSLHTGVLVDALAALPVAQRQALLLRHVVGLSAHEVAHRLERSEQAVNNLNNRARESLRCSLANLRDVENRGAEPMPRAEPQSLGARQASAVGRPPTGLRHIVPIVG
jgi:RNA polymerase sigma-70 factor (ECF subfamily)